jgi:membrane peptidoglycan carboxypeptidase
MKHVDDLVRAKHRKGDTAITYPQVALIALNPHTGQVLALVGGRDYATSQLNHAMAQRPTGSTFKPFVYATAYNSSLTELTSTAAASSPRSPASTTTRRTSAATAGPTSPATSTAASTPAWSPLPTPSRTRSTSPPSLSP